MIIKDWLAIEYFFLYMKCPYFRVKFVLFKIKFIQLTQHYVKKQPKGFFF